MKSTPTFLFVCLFILFLFSCGNSRNLQAQFRDTPYFLIEQGEQDLTEITLFVPVTNLPRQEVQLDSVYFRGRKAALVPSKDEVYVAVFRSVESRKDFVMDINPKKEYGNRVPVLPEKIPFDLAKDEAVIVFSKNGKKGYYKLDGILRRE